MPRSRRLSPPAAVRTRWTCWARARCPRPAAGAPPFARPLWTDGLDPTAQRPGRTGPAPRSPRARSGGRWRCARGSPARRVEVGRLVRVHDRPVLGRQVRAALELAAADHLHHQVHREVAVEAGEQRVAGQVDLVLVEGGVGRVPLRVRDGAAVRPSSSRKRRSSSRADLVRPPTRPPGARARAGRRSPRRSPPRSAASRSSRGATSRSAGPRRRARVRAWWTGLRETPSDAASSCRLTFSPGPSSRRRGPRLQRLVDPVVQVRPRRRRDGHAAIVT